MIVQTIRNGRVVSVDTRLDPAFGGTNGQMAAAVASVEEAQPDPQSDPLGNWFALPGVYTNEPGADDAVTVNTLLQRGSSVRLLPLAYNTRTAINLREGQYLTGPGNNLARINFSGTGDCLSQTTPASAYNSQQTTFGGCRGFTIDGTNAGAGSNGLHAGDIANLYYNLIIQNFTGAGSIGYKYDNRVYFTERLQGVLAFSNCTVGVNFDVNGGTNSFERPNLVIWVDSRANQTAVSLTGITASAQITSGNIGIFGNFNGGTGNSCLSLAGTGSLAAITAVRLDIGVENNSAASAPATITYAAGTNSIVNCYGIMNFLTPAGSAAWNTSVMHGGNFRYQGLVSGDTTLQTMLQLGQLTIADPGNNGTYQTSNTSSARTVPAGARTGMILQAATAGQAGKPYTLVNASANSITFAASGSNVADGSSDVIAANTAATYIWDGTTLLWYRQ